MTVICDGCLICGDFLFFFLQFSPTSSQYQRKHHNCDARVSINKNIYIRHKSLPICFDCGELCTKEGGELRTRVESYERRFALVLDAFHSCDISMHFVVVPFLCDFVVVISTFHYHVFALRFGFCALVISEFHCCALALRFCSMVWFACPCHLYVSLSCPCSAISVSCSCSTILLPCCSLR